MGISVVLSLYSMYPKKFLYFLWEIKFSRKSVFSAVFRNKESFPRRNGIPKIREIAKMMRKRYCAAISEYIMSHRFHGNHRKDIAAAISGIRIIRVIRVQK